MRLALPLLATGLAVAALPAAATGADRIGIEVLSNRADLISNGDAVVAVQVPAGVDASRLRIRVGRRDVTKAFSMHSGGRLEGLVDGLRVGANVVSAFVPRGRGARLTITNHPNGGPVFSGPQVQPWECQQGAVDKQCNQPPQYSYLYKSTDPTNAALEPYDPENPPTDVADTTTDHGVTVPFIVRVEIGYQDRDQYRIATLFQPGRPWDRWAPQKQFNHKLLITHGGGCNVSYGTGTAPTADYSGTLPAPVPGVPDSWIVAVGRGFATLSTALDNNGHNCNIVTQAESLIMAKERVVEQYGDLRYTIGTGCSGGSLTQQQVANAYPGVYQGILPQCSFPDSWSSAAQVADYRLLRTYFEDQSRWGPGVVWTPDQWGAVEGHVLPLNAIVSDVGYFSAFDPTQECSGVTGEQRYHPQTNPGGVRCSVPDYMINVLGPRPASVWTEPEKKIGRGFAGIALGNVGVQYGLALLERGLITPAQFADVNAKVGGLDLDINPTSERIASDRPALENAYRSGAINETNNLDQTAIIDLRGPDPGAAHDAYRAFAVRARLDREHGGHANHVIWEGAAPIIGDVQYTAQGLVAMDRWLAAVEADEREVPLARKVVERKPADIHDQCSDGAGTKLIDNLCPEVVAVYGTPRTVAGDAITTDNNECQLAPLRREGYSVQFSDDQWAQLQSAFPTGVCDYSKPGVDQVDTIPWLTYQDAAGKVVYGGRPLGAPPAATACRHYASLRLVLPRARRGQRLSRVRVYVNGKRVRTLRGRALRRPLTLKRFPAGTVRVRLVARSVSGRQITRNRRFSVCGA